MLRRLKINKSLSILWLLLLLLLLVGNGNVWGFALTDKTLPYTAPDVSFLSQDINYSLKEYQGQKVLLWMFSTWCHTCVAGVKALEKNQQTLEKHGLMILAIRNHNNGGYPGSDMRNFMEKFGPYTLESNSWVLGESSREMYKQLNPVKYPDVYFLIDEQGLIQTVSTAPNVTMKTILNFAKGSVNRK